MMLSSFLDNLAPWAVQVLVIGSIGAVLPLLFRLQHPRSQLVYCHLLLVACVVLPLIQPWHHPVIAAESIQKAIESTGVAYASAKFVLSPQTAARSWNRDLLWLLMAGIAARLCWTLVGLWQLGRYRAAAKPLYPIPQSIRRARLLVQADADFCTTSTGAGPLTFGFFRKVILLPESFVDLDEEAQVGIACHELLHVRRNDWLITLFEEFAAALFWFHPAIWWMLAQARLAREQLVDGQVVRITASREPYINALLAIAGARPRLDLAPAPLFLRRRHLLQRMHFLLTEVSMSRLRLVSSYASMAAILALAGWMVFVSFPLVGQAEVKPAVPQAQSPGYVVNVPPVYYPPEALQKRIEGTVVVELTFNVNGDITDSRVISGPEELRKAGLESALRGSYKISVARTLQILVEFKVPPPPPAAPPAPGQRGGGPRGNGPARPNVASLFPGILESIEIHGLEGSDLAQMQQKLAPFQGKTMSTDLIDQINDAIRAAGVSTPRQSTNFAPTANNNTTLVLTFSTAPLRVRVGGNVAANNLIRSVDPVYPPLAKQARIQGVVVLEAEITKEGKVENLRVITGHPLLIQAAIEAVKQWEYTPIRLNGDAVDIVTTVTLNFTLPPQ